MAHKLPELPYAMDALEPHISRETLEYHYGKHHNAYVVNLNGMLEGTELAGATLEDVIRKSSGPVFNNAAQIWNHTFYWNCLSPNGGGQPAGELAAAIDKAFGSFDAFKTEFTDKAVKLFGSGWAWLVKKADGSVAIVQTSNADTPVSGNDTALLTCD
ncbi:MAG: Fe-Mn family superoxide dismutase, partial [Gammaproteobacteria bacterium]